MKRKVERAKIEHILFLWDYLKDVYTRSEFPNFFENKNIKVVEYREDGELVGVGALDGCSLIMGAVAESHRETGLHERMIRERLRLIKDNHGQAGICCRARNIASMRNIIKCGFMPVGSFLYDNGDEGIQFIKIL